MSSQCRVLYDVKPVLCGHLCTGRMDIQQSVYRNALLDTNENENNRKYKDTRVLTQLLYPPSSRVFLGDIIGYGVASTEARMCGGWSRARISGSCVCM